MISAASSSSLSSGGAADDTVAATSDHGKSSLGPLNASVYKSLQTYIQRLKGYFRLKRKRDMSNPTAVAVLH